MPTTDSRELRLFLDPLLDAYLCAQAKSQGFIHAEGTHQGMPDRERYAIELLRKALLVVDADTFFCDEESLQLRDEIRSLHVVARDLLNGIDSLSFKLSTENSCSCSHVRLTNQQKLDRNEPSLLSPLPYTDKSFIDQREQDNASVVGEWMSTADAFRALGGDPLDRNSTIFAPGSSKPVKFNTFRLWQSPRKYASLGLELDRRRRMSKKPCLRFKQDLLRQISKVSVTGSLCRVDRTDNPYGSTLSDSFISSKGN